MYWRPQIVVNFLVFYFSGRWGVDLHAERWQFRAWDQRVQVSAGVQYNKWSFINDVTHGMTVCISSSVLSHRIPHPLETRVFEFQVIGIGKFSWGQIPNFLTNVKCASVNRKSQNWLVSYFLFFSLISGHPGFELCSRLVPVDHQSWLELPCRKVTTLNS